MCARTSTAVLDDADATALARGTDETLWTNEELLFHTLFGSLIVRSLLALVRLLCRPSARVGRSYSGLLDASTWLFDHANYFDSVADSRVFGCGPGRGPGARTRRDGPSATTGRRDPG
ncbi:hypothetical protein ACFXPN_45165 [Streptomyces griseorubiginosus]|uniref:hypothetical protein n=1 Tax=Streptomyces griseorubiginosus TaxID=67304 RepID=UPI0036D00D90